MDGFQLIAEMQADPTLRGIPIVVISGPRPVRPAHREQVAGGGTWRRDSDAPAPGDDRGARQNSIGAALSTWASRADRSPPAD